MLTFMFFVFFDADIGFAVEMYKDRKSCGDDMIAKIAKYYPEGMRRDVYVVCDPKPIIGTSLIPPFRGS